ncbi:MAG: hypothetical protein ABIA21_04030 [Candidatus Aenigmatarchaeota archaeon]
MVYHGHRRAPLHEGCTSRRNVRVTPEGMMYVSRCGSIVERVFDTFYAMAERKRMLRKNPDKKIRISYRYIGWNNQPYRRTVF